MNVQEMVGTVVFGAVALVLAIIILSGSDAALSPSITQSVLSSSLSQSVVTSGDTLSFLSFGFTVAAGLCVIGIAASMGKGDD
jgi:hypothetical protein